jgi:hypothetical protein
VIPDIDQASDGDDTLLVQPDAREDAEDLAVALTENAHEDWSFGNGQASYLELPRESWH